MTIVLALCAAGCGEELGPIAVELGTYDEQQGFAAFSTGAELDVISGLQGGYWSMPALRTRGMPEKTFVLCEVLLDGEVEPFSETAAEGFFDHRVDDWLQIDRFGIFLTYDSAVADTVDGKTASVACEVRDLRGERAGDTRVLVLLRRAEGF